MLPLPAKTEGYDSSRTYGLLRVNAAALFVALRKRPTDKDWAHFDKLRLIQGHLVALDTSHLDTKSYLTVPLRVLDGAQFPLTDNDLCAVINDVRTRYVSCPRCGAIKSAHEKYLVCLKDGSDMRPLDRVAMVNFHFDDLDVFQKFNKSRKKPYPILGLVDEERDPVPLKTEDEGSDDEE